MEIPSFPHGPGSIRFAMAKVTVKWVYAGNGIFLEQRKSISELNLIVWRGLHPTGKLEKMEIQKNPFH